MDIQSIIQTLKTDWKECIEKYDFSTIEEFMKTELILLDNQIKIFPPKHLIFNCFDYFNIKDTKVVILGQDPYINVGEAMGLCFSVPDGIKVPPSLKNIYKEMEDDLKTTVNKESGDLTHWAEKGVLLLNTALTVRQYKSNSHKKVWQDFTDYMIETVSKETDNVVFILWGRYAQSKKKYIDCEKHLILEATHPSPLGANKGGFFGCKHFSLTNKYLEEHAKGKVF